MACYKLKMLESTRLNSAENEVLDSDDHQQSKNNSPKEHLFICTYDDCNKSYTSQSHLKRHEDTHENRYMCTVKNCGQTFKSKFTLKKHVDNIHLKKKPKKYMCTECGDEFNKHNWLTKHQFKHTGVKPYECPKEGCEKRFLVPSKLKRHLKIHEGYTCLKENCGQNFPKWTLYVRHLKTAHPRIHRCHDCKKTFTTSFNLKAHVEVHKFDRDVFLCPKPNCSRFYFMKRNLTHHLKSYHDKRPFVCSEEHCYKAFKTEVDLKSHITRHDPKKRARKKKKKNPKPSFAAKLAGLVPKVKPSQQTTEDEKLEDSNKLEEKTGKAEGEESNKELCIDSIDCNVLNNSHQEELAILNCKITVLESKSFHQESTVECISA